MSWVLASALVLAVALAAGFAWYEREHPTTRVLALVATLAALAALGRVAFAPLPNVKPTTDIVLLGGYALGGAPGFVIGAVAALASNLFFGQGPWTPWQMVAWGGCGLLGAGLARVAGRELGRIPLAAVCAFAGLAFGAVMNVSQWVMYSGDHTQAKLVASFATSVPFDVAHAVGNAVFCLAFGPALVRSLARFRTRLDVRWEPAAGIAAAGAVVAALVLAAAPAPPARADALAQAARSSQSWLLRVQNADGGWGSAPGAASSGLYTGWAALGVAAAGTNPRDAGSPSVVAWLQSHPGQLTDLGAISRTVLVLRAAGVRARVGSRDLVAAIASRQRRDGSFQRRVNTTAFAILALRAAGRGGPGVRRAATWLAGQANADGGFNFAGRGGPSGADDTGAALQALVAAGRRGTPAVRGAARWLAGHENRDGGFPLQPGGVSNAQSTAWAVQGLIAAGRSPRRALAFLRSLTTRSGLVRYSRLSSQTPVWVTGQAVMALARKPLPLAPVARKARRAAARPAPAPAAAATPSPTATVGPAKPKAKVRAARVHAARPRASRDRSLLVGSASPLVLARTAGFVAGAAAAILWPSTAPAV
ncbi:MAG TPA: prenyltransferase/squalene oxidase repeat-containing protein [Solirubrobacteraceae bacterium]|nr:prenyltransferase/squalene oxidase repeat-containing protein [Solirubrobacteraceae bacterium]